jgi:hypothetical protein
LKAARTFLTTIPVPASPVIVLAKPQLMVAADAEIADSRPNNMMLKNPGEVGLILFFMIGWVLVDFL